MKTFLKSTTLLLMGGGVYYAVELLWRGYSHGTMFVLGGLCFLLLGGMNEYLPWNMGLLQQAFIGMVVITIAEFFAGLVLNLWLGLGIWDYSEMRGNVLGQICPQYCLAWMALSPVGIVLDDVLRWKLFGEEKPWYTLV